MKICKNCFVFTVLLLCIAVNSNAALVDNHDGTITDTSTNLMWLQDANSWAAEWYENFDDAIYWASQLTYAGYDDWRLPRAYNQDGSGPCQGYNCTDSEFGNLYYTVLGNSASTEPKPPANTGPFINVSQYGYWTNNSYDGNDAWLFDFATGYQLHTYRGTSGVPAWAVREISSSPPVVPEPIGSLLFVTGGTLLAGTRFIKRMIV